MAAIGMRGFVYSYMLACLSVGRAGVTVHTRSPMSANIPLGIRGPRSFPNGPVCLGLWKNITVVRILMHRKGNNLAGYRPFLLQKKIAEQHPPLTST